MLKIISILVVLLAGAVLVFAASKPDTFRVQRSTTVHAPAEKIFPLINEFERWDGWSPWEKKDPAMKRARSGPPAGKGAAYAWEGDKNVGKGRMEILESTPPSRIAIRLDFEKPFEAHNRVEFSLRPEAGGTIVTWAMHGPANFVSKLMQVFFDMDAMVGKDFETGLASLKALSEK